MGSNLTCKDIKVGDTLIACHMTVEHRRHGELCTVLSVDDAIIRVKWHSGGKIGAYWPHRFQKVPVSLKERISVVLLRGAALTPALLEV